MLCGVVSERVQDDSTLCISLNRLGQRPFTTYVRCELVKLQEL